MSTNRFHKSEFSPCNAPDDPVADIQLSSVARCEGHTRTPHSCTKIVMGQRPGHPPGGTRVDKVRSRRHGYGGGLRSSGGSQNRGAVSDTSPWGTHFQGAPENSAIKTIFSCDIFHVKINTKIHAKQNNQIYKESRIRGADSSFCCQL